MKVKHTKLKKSIFLILICISLTTTFVVSASAYETSSTVTVNYPGGSLTFPFQYFSSNGYNQIINLLYFPSDTVYEGVSIPANSSFLLMSYGEAIDMNIEPYPSFPISFTGFVDSISLSMPSFSDESLSLPLVYEDYSFCLSYLQLLSFVSDTDIILTFNSSSSSSSSPSFTDSVGSGLTSSLSWVGQVVESLTTGPIKPLLECFAVTISVSALLLGIYSIRRFIWGA